MRSLTPRGAMGPRALLGVLVVAGVLAALLGVAALSRYDSGVPALVAGATSRAATGALSGEESGSAGETSSESSPEADTASSTSPADLLSTEPARGPGLAASDAAADPVVPGPDASQLVALSALPPAPTPDGAALFVRTEPPDRDLVDLAQRMGRTDGLAERTLGAPRPEPALGQAETFWVHDIVTERYFEANATVRAITDAAYFWIQDGLEYDQADLDAGATEFSSQIVPQLRAIFGDEWLPGVDLDARMHVLHHEPIRGVAGYYSSADEFTTDVEPHSNEREMFYINRSVYDPGSYDWLALLAHEFQHMIHWHKDANESVWANEGLSELAASLAGYPAQNGGQFFAEPDTPLLEWNEDPSRNGADYAASFAFFSYVLGQYGEEAIRAIVAEPGNGPAGIEAGLAKLGADVRFDDVFLDWVVANAVDDPTVLGGRFSYRGQSLEQVRPDPLEAAASARVSPFATDYYDATAAVSGGRLEMDFDGDAMAQLIGAPADDVGMVWWSNRGDGADSRLTGRFAIPTLDTGVGEAARLQFRLWYDLETNWDFAYFLVSTDGGATWEKVATPRTTDEDPNGNNFGSGLTGSSGGWVDESLDLSAYGGREVLVRVEVVTDDAVSLSGLALDDLGLSVTTCLDAGCTDQSLVTDDGEASRGASGAEAAVWDSSGFLRIHETLPQRWALQAIVHRAGRILGVSRPQTDEGGQARLSVEVPDDASVIVAVSNLTPGTRQPAGYRLTGVTAQASPLPTGNAATAPITQPLGAPVTPP